jgi:hypothetical protein
MTKLKKHQLLEKAMRDYPKGTVAYWVKGKERILSGVYEITPAGDVFDNESNFYLFDQNKWAEILPESKPSILDGKVAIQVNNEREFKLLKEHYKEKGWGIYDRGYPQIKIYDNQSNGFSVYEQQTMSDLTRNAERLGYTVLSFSDFAAEVSITVPKFIMKSEDEVDLYEGDDHHVATSDIQGNWTYAGNQQLMTSHFVVNYPDRGKAFSTLEAAEAWIAEKNIRKEIIISPESQYPISVNKEGALILCEGLNHVDNIRLKGKEIEEMYAAYQSLNGKEVDNG